MPDPVATEIAGGNSSSLTTTVSFSAQAAGTFLALWVSADNYRTTSGSGRPESTGWTLRHGQEGNLGCYLWWILSTGAETSVQYTLAGSGLSCYAITAVTEIDGTTPIDVSTSAIGGVGSFTTGSTPSSGTTTSGRRIALGGLGVATPNGATSMSTWTNSYTEIHDRTTTAGYRDGIGVSYLVFDGGGTTSTGATFNVTVDQVAGITLVLKNAAAGGSNFSRPIQRRPHNGLIMRGRR